jgi:hypothetical protein
MAQLAAMDAYIQQSGEGLDAWTRMKAEDQPNLRGAMNYVSSPRHANYVDVSIYRRVLTEIRERFGWPDPDGGLYEGLRRAANETESPAAETIDGQTARGVIRAPAA